MTIVAGALLVAAPERCAAATGMEEVAYRRDLGTRDAAIGAASFAALTAVDGLAAAALRSAGR